MHILIRNTSGAPIYEQIFDQIRDQILSGELEPGAALPSIRSLAKDLRISVITTKRAYEELEREGFLISIPGKGSYVAQLQLCQIPKQQLHHMEEALRQSVRLARECHLSLEDLKAMVETIYREE